jgi:hypothetical protein
MNENKSRAAGGVKQTKNLPFFYHNIFINTVIRRCKLVII